MPQPTHESLVAEQFGRHAAGYVSSPVHAQGDDLARLAAIAAADRPAVALDLGCGGGHAAYAIAPACRRVLALDLAPEMLAAVRAEAAARRLDTLETVEGSVERLPVETASVDLVVSRYSAHHWRDLAAALAEARRVLRAGGRMVVIDTVTPGVPLADTWLQTIELLRDPSHVRNRTGAEWLAALATAGFTPTATRGWRRRLDFASWVGRMDTPAVRQQAIRDLQAQMPPEARDRFAVEADGSFTLDVMEIEARPV